ncbi:acyl-CoA dehydrogenase family protein [Dietzia alimentaria]|uniref:acyl-CoA dehydrogenase family protein n=1 Tax=Dietzia alimentaria TaxID=665550 RepID=UPI00029AEBF8|nr:acyl-CoA dehydrogenase family protein [Dietzia alimentaria]
MRTLFADHNAPWMTEERLMLRDHAFEFAMREIAPHQERWAENKQVDRELWNAAGAAGLLCADIPEEYGGGGGTFSHEAVVQHAFTLAGDNAFGYSVGSTIVPHYLLQFGTEEQKKHYLPKLASGEMVGAIAMTEPSTGSDLQSIRTTAQREGDEYVINGSKTFITNGSHCDLLLLVCKTDPSAKGKGISILVLDTRDLAGFDRGRVLNKLGMHGQDTRKLFFDDCRVPVSALLGEQENQGFVQLMQQLGRERLIIGCTAAAAAEFAVLEAIDYTRERNAFGRPVADFQNTRHVLAQNKADAYAGRAMCDAAMVMADEGRLDPTTASMVKLWTTEMQCRVVDQCLQLFGGYGYMMEYPIARAYAAARVQKIYGGTNEIMKELIGRTL